MFCPVSVSLQPLLEALPKCGAKALHALREVPKFAVGPADAQVGALEARFPPPCVADAACMQCGCRCCKMILFSSHQRSCRGRAVEILQSSVCQVRVSLPCGRRQQRNRRSRSRPRGGDTLIDSSTAAASRVQKVAPTWHHGHAVLAHLGNELALICRWPQQAQPQEHACLRRIAGRQPLQLLHRGCNSWRSAKEEKHKRCIGGMVTGQELAILRQRTSSKTLCFCTVQMER